jgi:predicted permease
MGGQVALALELLLASGLMVRSFQNLLAVDPGFDSASALTFRVGLPQTEYTSRDAAASVHQTILDRLKGIPGVIAVSASTCLPLAGGCHGNTMRVEGRAAPPGTIPPIVSFRAVAGGYVETMRMRLLKGRGLDRRDVERREPVVVINSALARAYFPNEDPINRRVSFGRSGTWFTVVGLVANTSTRALNESAPVPKLFMPMSIAGGPGMAPTDLASLGPDISVITYVVRSTTPPLSLLPSVRRAIDTVDENLALADVKTLADVLAGASAQMAFTMILLAIAASVSLVLGLVGIYGVMSYIVTQRTSEIGVRLALGATPGSVATEVVRQGALVAVIGVLIGVTSAVAGSRFIDSLLFQVRPRDPKVFVATALTLIAVTIVACWLPARRAARISPLEALRSE